MSDRPTSRRRCEDRRQDAETETATAQAVATECSPTIRRERRGRRARLREEARPVGRRDRAARRAEIERRAAEVPAQVRRDIDFATAQVREFALAQRESLREFSVEPAPGRHRRPARAAGQRRRLLRARRALRAHRVGLHGRGHRQGRRREDHHRLLGAVPRRADAPLRALRVRRGRRRRDHDARRRAGDRRPWPTACSPASRRT